MFSKTSVSSEWQLIIVLEFIRTATANGNVYSDSRNALIFELKWLIKDIIASNY